MKCPYIGETNCIGIEYNYRQEVIAVTNTFLIKSCLYCPEKVCYLEKTNERGNDNTNKNAFAH